MKKTVVSIISALSGAVLGGGVVGKKSTDKMKKIQLMSDKHLALFLMMNQWVKVKQDGKDLNTYFEENGYKKIAIYGMSYAGKTLVEELKNTKIAVAYGIDQKAHSIYMDLDMVTMDDELEEVDAIVVTAITCFDEVEEQLLEKVNCPILSLEDILYEI